MPKRSLLIIDDNITNLKLVVEHLKAYSYEILTASKGETGLERAQLAQPDLILLDIKMPGIDGVEVCRRLKANPQTTNIPVIFMTASGQTEDKVRALEAGAVDYLTKPIDAAELVARVRTHLALRELQTDLEKRVQERTLALEQEIAHRRHNQEEKEQLLTLLRDQSDQLHQLTQKIISEQVQHNEGLADTLSQQVESKLEEMEQQLRYAEQLAHGPTLAPAETRQVRECLSQALSILGGIRQQAHHVTADLHHAVDTEQTGRDAVLFKLTPREYEVLQLIGQGKNNNDIAELLVVTKATVSTYRTRIMNKLGLEDTPALIRFALEQRLAK